MVEIKNGKLLKEIHENMIVFKEFAKNTNTRLCNIEENHKRYNDEQTELKIVGAKNDIWSKAKTITITILSGAVGWLAKTVIS